MWSAAQEYCFEVRVCVVVVFSSNAGQDGPLQMRAREGDNLKL